MKAFARKGSQPALPGIEILMRVSAQAALEKSQALTTLQVVARWRASTKKMRPKDLTATMRRLQSSKVRGSGAELTDLSEVCESKQASKQQCSAQVRLVPDDSLHHLNRNGRGKSHSSFV